MPVERKKRSSGADIQDRAEVQEIVAIRVEASHKHRDRKRKAWGFAPFFHSCTMRAPGPFGAVGRARSITFFSHLRLCRNCPDGH